MHSAKLAIVSLTKRLPVMVYIHGDFLHDGSSMEASPGFLMEKQIVLVSVKYRLGPFGFLSTNSTEIPGNAGVQDVILALEWIQKHIHNFGGDASNITLFGQAGGAAIINVLTMSQKITGKDLFHRVIYQSGVALMPAFITDDQSALETSQEMGQIAGCQDVENITSLNTCFLNLTSTEILIAFEEHLKHNHRLGVGHAGGMQMVIGGKSGILTNHPGKILASKSFKPYPTMGGIPKNVGTYTLKSIFIEIFNETVPDDDYTALDYINLAIAQSNGIDPTMAWTNYARNEFFTEQQFHNGSFEDLIPGLIDMCGTIAFKNPLFLTLQANAREMPNDTYLYSFDYYGEHNRYDNRKSDDADPLPFDLGASLTDENLYIFPWPSKSLLESPNDLRVARRMIDLWTSFATTGIPSAKGQTAWPSMSSPSGPYLKIDRSVTIGDNFLEEYGIAVREATKGGFNLVNIDFFSNLIEISRDADLVLQKLYRQI